MSLCFYLYSIMLNSKMSSIKNSFFMSFYNTSDFLSIYLDFSNRQTDRQTAFMKNICSLHIEIALLLVQFYIS